jgi:large subunit ribosomal protein L9
MEVILRQDVTDLGRAGEIVSVKDGYGRNYLIPRGLAYAASAGNKARIAAEAQRRVHIAASEKSAAEDLATKLATTDLTFTAKVGEGDRLFGSITSADIAEKLTELGYPIDKRIIDLPEPIKLIGVYKVAVRLHHDVRPELRVWVVKGG